MRVEQTGAERCEVAANGGFVLVRVPVRIAGESERDKAVAHYVIGGFVGRETSWPLRRGSETTLTFRIPGELFRERERLSLEVRRKDSPADPETLWAKRYEVRWVNGSPQLEPVPD